MASDLRNLRDEAGWASRSRVWVVADTADNNYLDVAQGVLPPRPVLRSFWLTCALAMAVPAVGWAQSAPTPAKAAVSPAAVDKARAAITTAERTVATLTTQRGQLTARYQQQLAAIDRLKKQKASWRRDRELNTAQADANDTAKRLTALDASLHKAQATLLVARANAVRAIDAELAAGTTGARRQQLASLRARLAPPLPAPKKIVIPDAEIDPLADPQELEQQAAALAAVEKQLEAQRKGLDAQHKDLVLVAELRGAHERAGELATRDDDQPQRGGSRTSTGRGGADEATAPSAGNDSAGGAGGGAGQGGGTTGTGTETTGGSFGGDKLTGSTFETNAAVALGEVIDRTTIDGLVRASRSGDPKQRAEAAKQARDAVGKRLEQLRKKRAMIEQRAKQLRGK